MLSSVLTCKNLPLISIIVPIKKHPYRIANRGAIMEFLCRKLMMRTNN